MKPDTRAKCISITKKVFQQPLGEYARKILPSYLTILPDIDLSLDKIEEKLEKWKYLSIDDWHDDIIGLLSAVSHECDQNLSLVFDTIIQMIEDEMSGFKLISEENVISDVQYAIDHYLPNSKFDFYHDRKPPPFHQSIQKMPSEVPEFTLDSINLLKERIYGIQSTRKLSKIAKIIQSNLSNEGGITEIKGGISVVFEALSPYTLQIIQNYINKITKESEI